MEEDNAARPSANAHVVGVKSWIAYFGTLVLAALLFFGLLPLAFMWNEIAAGVVFVLSALLVGYRLLCCAASSCTTTTSACGPIRASCRGKKACPA